MTFSEDKETLINPLICASRSRNRNRNSVYIKQLNDMVHVERMNRAQVL